MNILVTGITGLLGSFAAKQLLAEGHSVTALIRKNADLSLIQDILPKITIVEGDINDVFSIDEALKGNQWVLHAAGLVSYNAADKARLFKINVEGTANIVNACLQHGIEKLVHVSSVAAVGIKPNLEIQTITEENDWNDQSASSNYALSKYLGELEVWRGIAEGLQAVIINPSMILGEADWNKTSTRLFKYAFDQHPFYTAGSLNFVDVLDVVKSISALFYSSLQAERYILSAGSITVAEFFQKTAANFSKKPPYIKLGAWAVAILWRIEHIRSLLSGADPLITKETAKTARKKHHYSGQKIAEALGISYTPLNETLNRVCKNLLQKNQ